ncbi:carboxypeptidase-like regulatory domain-containing protein [Flavobacterium rakeshii]|uniref:carboxypeptidase-like regulatory domain-containing protein n=1 Tax=Flavobacterium rakeshii TaxID=1038845 RepID=UPI002E7ACDF3|nr:carboxypeptidase-like regulatory domain-containing protein [Flavobacterium rakeshii]MEE1899016.1 carboxypeptidase-like regulatory domain-containing protein [Flavobacterium rakeshii]
MKKLFFSFLLLLYTCICAAQQSAMVQCRVIDMQSGYPVENAVATLQSTNQTAITNSEGILAIEVPAGKQILIVSSNGYVPQTFNLTVIPERNLDLGIVLLELDLTAEQQLNLITLTENDLNESIVTDNTSGLLQASKDALQQAAAYSWSQARYKTRGLDSRYATTMINGVTMNKISDGRPQWNNWSGLNDATRNQEFNLGTTPSDYSFGGLLGTQEINTRASQFRKGTRISFTATNTSYNWRSMATYASGMNKKGFGYVISASHRWAEEANFNGTDYGGNSLFVSMEKKLNDNHSINFTGIYAQSSRGKNSANTQEVTNLMGKKYNSYWGYQDGKKRNSRDIDIAEPIFILSHYYKINPHNTLQSNVAYQFGKIGNSRIDFQNVPNPDPSYYRNLPSYYTSQYENNPALVPNNAYQPGGLGGIYTGNSPENTLLAQQALGSFTANPQINWSNMYLANTRAVTNTNNIETGREPSVSRYVLYEDRNDDNTLSINSTLQSQLSPYIVFNGGVSFKHLKSHNYKKLLDLLGGSHYNDISPFFSGSQAQSDLNNPNRTVGVNDIYGYNYNLFAGQLDAFTQFRFTYRKTDLYLSQSYSRSDYQREGLYRNGIYANSSLGKSNRVSFDNFGFKGGVLYKITGRVLFALNGMYMTKAPALRNTFPNARLNNSIVQGIESENIASIDASYIIRVPKFKVRLSAFYTLINNVTETSFFFAEGVYQGENTETNAFIAETVTGINKKLMGTEVSTEYNFNTMFKVLFSMAYGQYTYNSNPTVYINNDAFASLQQEVNTPGSITGPTTSFGASRLKDYKLPGMPQQALSLGFEYRDPKYWWAGINANYLTGSYLDISALLRTNNFLKNPQDVNSFSFPEATQSRTRELLKQEQFDDIFLLNAVGGKSWRVKKKTYLGFFASINNIFNSIYKTGGYEQARNANYRQLNQDVSSGTPSFGPKYFYSYGRTFYLNIYYNF